MVPAQDHIRFAMFSGAKLQILNHLAKYLSFTTATLTFRDPPDAAFPPLSRKPHPQFPSTPPGHAESTVHKGHPALRCPPEPHLKKMTGAPDKDPPTGCCTGEQLL